MLESLGFEHISRTVKQWRFRALKIDGPMSTCIRMHPGQGESIDAVDHRMLGDLQVFVKQREKKKNTLYSPNYSGIPARPGMGYYW